MIVFLGLAILTKYVSLASLCAYTTALISMIIFGQMGFYHMPQKYLTEMYIVFGALTLLTFYRHRQNIVRLMNGTESKLSLGSKKVDRRDYIMGKISIMGVGWEYGFAALLHNNGHEVVLGPACRMKWICSGKAGTCFKASPA